ncbi:MAG: hypothetical protein LBU97_01845, partial [Alistipes sp.]|nr:hypothetical protein [Alistipes sp.]
MSGREQNVKREPNIKREITLRVNLLYVLFFALGICIFGRILWLQYGPGGEDLRRKAQERAFYMEMIDGKRGEIVSADGELLATSILMYHLGMDFRVLRVDSLSRARFAAGVGPLSDSLAALFGDRTAAGYRALLESGFGNEGAGYRRLNSRLISYPELERVRTFPLLSLPPGQGGLSIEQIYSRQRPFGRLAERTIGTTAPQYDTVAIPDSDSTDRRVRRLLTERGRYGIEYSFDDTLRGKAGWQMMQRQTERFSTPVESPLNIPTANGRTV